VIAPQLKEPGAKYIAMSAHQVSLFKLFNLPFTVAANGLEEIPAMVVDHNLVTLGEQQNLGFISSHSLQPTIQGDEGLGRLHGKVYGWGRISESDYPKGSSQCKDVNEMFETISTIGGSGWFSLIA
jgi:hypothetical protein